MRTIHAELAKDKYGKVKRLGDGSYRFSLQIKEDEEIELSMDGFRLKESRWRISCPQIVYGNKALILAELSRGTEEKIIKHVKALIREAEAVK